MLNALDRRCFLVQSTLSDTALPLPRRHAWSTALSESVVDTISEDQGAAIDGVAAFKEFPMALQRQTRSGGKRHFAALGAADLDGTRGLQPHRVRRFYCCSTGGSSREEDLAL